MTLLHSLRLHRLSLAGHGGWLRGAGPELKAKRKRQRLEPESLPVVGASHGHWRGTWSAPLTPAAEATSSASAGVTVEISQSDALPRFFDDWRSSVKVTDFRERIFLSTTDLTFFWSNLDLTSEGLFGSFITSSDAVESYLWNVGVDKTIERSCSYSKLLWDHRKL